ncbi:hypothetical protein MNBD_GAMMA08-1563 [hydrothermal vent metagenome]|uniref:Uncharacterized protein n=1 Tax=hydrothermal vent metagenome TaxID=652676 RepID=A0A3B0XMW4_9ZZZZ
MNNFENASKVIHSKGMKIQKVKRPKESVIKILDLLMKINISPHTMNTLSKLKPI